MSSPKKSPSPSVPFSREARSEPAETSLEEIYAAFFLTLVRRASWRYGLSKEDSAEIVQEAFLLALTKVDLSRNPKGWLSAVVDRMALNWRRKAARRARLMGLWQPPPTRIRDTEGSE